MIDRVIIVRGVPSGATLRVQYDIPVVVSRTIETHEVCHEDVTWEVRAHISCFQEVSNDINAPEGEPCYALFNQLSKILEPGQP